MDDRWSFFMELKQSICYGSTTRITMTWMTENLQTQKYNIEFPHIALYDPYTMILQLLLN